MKTTNREKLDKKLLSRAEDLNDNMWAVMRRLTVANSDFSRAREALTEAFASVDFGSETELVFERIHVIQEKQAGLSAELNRLRAAAAAMLKKTDKRTRQLGREPLVLA